MVISGVRDLLCDDGNGATPEIVDRMLVQSKIGQPKLLAALPATLPPGTVSGLRARGFVTVTTLRWDTVAGTGEVTLISPMEQNLTLIPPPGTSPNEVTVYGVQGCEINLPAGKSVPVTLLLHAMPSPAHN